METKTKGMTTSFRSEMKIVPIGLSASAGGPRRKPRRAPKRIPHKIARVVPKKEMKRLSIVFI